MKVLLKVSLTIVLLIALLVVKSFGIGGILPNILIFGGFFMLIGIIWRKSKNPN